jgi:hypothetical protein
VTRTFYPDYLVSFKNDTIGIFDTKLGLTAKDATQKAKALQRYFNEFYGNGEKGLFGGILVEQKGNWMLNRAVTYVFNPKDFGEWAFLD